jgi:HD-GYP domain-containing protein (c-di-GMP phosphodiesterase class II)
MNDSNKPLVMLVDRLPMHRSEFKAWLTPLYRVVDFAGMADALRYARKNPLSALVIAEDRTHGEDFYFLKSLRLEPAFAFVPIIVIMAEQDASRLVNAKRYGASACLTKPYLPSALVNLISGLLNQAKEAEWNNLPAVEAEALKSTLAMFNNMSDIIATGAAISYQEVQAACVPLVQAVSCDSIKRVLKKVRDYDNYTYAHSLRVGAYLAVFATGIGLSAESQTLLATGGLVHDIGKMLIPALILNKPGRLTNDESDIMRSHVPATLNLLQTCPDLPRGVAIIAGQHHEKLDGSGYPNGLKGHQLNELARMSSIVDIFCALTDRRVYKPSMEATAAFAFMTSEMSSHLDMRLLANFREMLLDSAVV